jgi:hypothetical protein
MIGNITILGFGLRVTGSTAVGVVGLPLYPKHQYDRKIRSYNFGFWVLGQPRWTRSYYKFISDGPSFDLICKQLAPL